MFHRPPTRMVGGLHFEMEAPAQPAKARVAPHTVFQDHGSDPWGAQPRLHQTTQFRGKAGKGVKGGILLLDQGPNPWEIQPHQVPPARGKAGKGFKGGNLVEDHEPDLVGEQPTSHQPPPFRRKGGKVVVKGGEGGILTEDPGADVDGEQFRGKGGKGGKGGGMTEELIFQLFELLSNSPTGTLPLSQIGSKLGVKRKQVEAAGFMLSEGDQNGQMHVQLPDDGGAKIVEAVEHTMAQIEDIEAFLAQTGGVAPLSIVCSKFLVKKVQLQEAGFGLLPTATHTSDQWDVCPRGGFFDAEAKARRVRGKGKTGKEELEDAPDAKRRKVDDVQLSEDQVAEITEWIDVTSGGVVSISTLVSKFHVNRSQLQQAGFVLSPIWPRGCEVYTPGSGSIEDIDTEIVEQIKKFIQDLADLQEKTTAQEICATFTVTLPQLEVAGFRRGSVIAATKHFILLAPSSAEETRAVANAWRTGIYVPASQLPPTQADGSSSVRLHPRIQAFKDQIVEFLQEHGGYTTVSLVGRRLRVSRQQLESFGFLTSGRNEFRQMNVALPLELGGSTPPIPEAIVGDWTCPGCQGLQFERNTECRCCGHPKPVGGQEQSAAPVNALQWDEGDAPADSANAFVFPDY